MNWDFESLIQILMLVLFGGIALIQFLYRVFVKPVADAEEARRGRMAERGEEPERNLRDFLAEVRGERPRREQREEAQGGLRGEEERERRPALRREEPERVPPEMRWEPVEEETPPPLPPKPPRVPPPRPGPRMPRQDGRAKAPRARAPKAPAPRAGQPARPRVTREARQKARELLEKLPGDQRFQFSGGQLESHVADHLAQTFEHLLGTEREKRLRERRHAARRGPLPYGVGLREAILAQVILGNPRARMGKRPPRGGWTRA